jgi:hypothetical protein
MNQDDRFGIPDSAQIEEALKVLKERPDQDQIRLNES